MPAQSTGKAVSGVATQAPMVSGQCAQVLSLIREHQPMLSLVLSADHAIPEAAARVHDLRSMGWNIITRMEPSVQFRERIRRNVAFYSLGVPEWLPPVAAVRKDGGGHEE